MLFYSICYSILMLFLCYFILFILMLFYCYCVSFSFSLFYLLLFMLVFMLMLFLAPLGLPQYSPKGSWVKKGSVLLDLGLLIFSSFQHPESPLLWSSLIFITLTLTVTLIRSPDRAISRPSSTWWGRSNFSKTMLLVNTSRNSTGTEQRQSHPPQKKVYHLIRQQNNRLRGYR